MLTPDPASGDATPLVPGGESTFGLDEIEDAICDVPWAEYLAGYERGHGGYTRQEAARMLAAKVAVAVLRRLGRRRAKKGAPRAD